MRHRIGGRKLNRTSSHRKAMFSNMVVSLFSSGQIKTTLAKAKELRPIVEKLITQGKRGKLSNRKNVISKIDDKEITKKLFDEISPKYKDRRGGYSRIVRAGFRYGDSAPMAYLQLVEEKQKNTPKK